MKLENVMQALSIVKDTAQDVTDEDLCNILALWEKRKSCLKKAEELIWEGVSNDFAIGWINEAHKVENEIRHYNARERR